MKYRIAVVGLGLLAAVNIPASALTENFSTNPFAAWSFGIGGTDPSTNRFVWNAGSAPAYAGDATGSLAVHLDSSLPTVRLDLPLGQTVTDTNSFTLSTRFSFAVTSAPDDTALQIAFGLVNHSLTGGDRTGSPSTSANAFHTVEFNYFPQQSPSWGAGRTLTPAVIGAQKGSSDAWGNFTALFGSASDLGDNTNGITALPENQTLEALLAYDGFNKVLTLTLSQVNADGSLTLLNTELPPLSLVGGGYDTNDTFQVDSLAIMAYQDGWLFGGPASLVADVSFQKMDFQIIPEPSTALLVGLGLAGLCFWSRRQRPVA